MNRGTEQPNDLLRSLNLYVAEERLETVLSNLSPISYYLPPHSRTKVPQWHHVVAERAWPLKLDVAVLESWLNHNISMGCLPVDLTLIRQNTPT